MQNPVPDERYSVADEAILGAFFKTSKEKNLLIRSQYPISLRQLVSREALFIIIIKTFLLLYPLLRKRRSRMFFL